MYCTQCGTQNLSESKYCRECGVKIPPAFEVEPLRLSVFQDIVQKAEAEEEPADPKLKQLLDMAFWHKNAGNTRGAILACEAALILNPDCTSALSLLGCLYEETGRDEDAVVMFERIVALNPTSTADVEKLEMLKKGIKVKSVEEPPLYRWTPPALAQAVHNRRIVPGIGAVVAAIAVLACGAAVLRATTGAHPAAATSSRAASASAVTPNVFIDPRPSVPTATPTMPQVTAASPAESTPSSTDPFAQAALIARLAKTPPPTRLTAPTGRHRGHDNVVAGVPPLPSVGSLPTAVPSVVDVRPLRPSAAPESVPSHFVQVTPVSEAPQHTVVVGGSQNDGTSTQVPDDPEQPAPPQSQIEISVQDAHATATDATAGSRRPTITLSEDPGAALQQKALSYQQQSDYNRASAAYQTAIGAYQQDIAAGRNIDEARRGIAACETGLQICKQSH